MSVCNKCTLMRDLIACTSTLTVGTITNLSTAIYVYIYNHTTDKLVRYSTTTSGTGLVQFDLSDGQTYMEYHDYELYITLQTNTDRIEFTIDSIEYECVRLKFKRTYDNDDALVSGTQTLKLL